MVRRSVSFDNFDVERDKMKLCRPLPKFDTAQLKIQIVSSVHFFPFFGVGKQLSTIVAAICFPPTPEPFGIV